MRNELNRIKRKGLTGMTLLEALSRVYYLCGLDIASATQETTMGENDELARVVCSEAGGGKAQAKIQHTKYCWVSRRVG